MNILLIYPEFPDTFWSYKHALKFVGKKASLPPLGLLTVAALFPKEWSTRLVDMNVRKLTKKDLCWADCVFISAMVVQRESARSIIHLCKQLELRVVVGGPLFANEHERSVPADHFILNEAETTLPAFINDLTKGTTKKIYTSDQFPELIQTPPPQWKLLELKRYASMSIQFSRGCPFQCDFCNITALFGHRVRIKTAQQILIELDGLYDLGWRGDVFFVDDNFIGNKQYLKTDLLPALIQWRKNKKGLLFFTEASINLSDDEELMYQMVLAGFNRVFIGIETPDDECLSECSKLQNKNRTLVDDVKLIQRMGLEVQGGFIVGFDNDQPSFFQRQIDFIQKSGIVTAMVGMLQAFPGTKLYDRMKKEGRLRGESTGDNVDGTTNIVPLMTIETLKEGYKSILNHIYSPDQYYKRIRIFLSEFKPPRRSRQLRFSYVLVFIHSLYSFGILSRYRFHYWRLLLWTQLRHPRLISQAVTMVICGDHFRKVVKQHVT